MKDGQAKIDPHLAFGLNKVNGWVVASAFGDRAFFNGNRLLRAAGAKADIYGNDAIEAVYPVKRTLENGELLDGSKDDYTLTFPAGQLPPVNAFWSITMYDGKTQFLIKNPINRYIVDSAMLPGMKKNPDGSLTIYLLGEQEDFRYVIAFSTNSRPLRPTAPRVRKAKAQFHSAAEKQRLFPAFACQADSWDRPRRLLAKVE